MAAGEVLLNGTQLDDGGTDSHATAANVLDADGMTYWHTDPTASKGYVGMDAGAACTLTRVRISPLGQSPAAVSGAFIQGNSSSVFPDQYGVVQSAYNYYNGASTSSLAATFTSTQVSGNANVVFVAGGGVTPSGVADPVNGSYTKLFDATATSPSCWIKTGIAAGAGPVVTATFGSSVGWPTIAIMEIYGVSGSGAAAMDNHSSGTGTSNAPSSGAFTTTSANTIILCFTFGGGTPTISAGTNFAILKNASPGWHFALEDRVVTTAGSYTGTFSYNTSVLWGCTAVAIKLVGAIPNILYTISGRPTIGTLMQEYSITGASPFRYYRYAAPVASNGNLADLDFIVQYTAGINAAAVAPTISPSSRVFDLPVVVRLASITTDASIYYTTNGTTPTTGSTLYTGPFVIGSSCDLKAIAVSASLSNSRVTKTRFNIAGDFQSLYSQVDDRNYKVWSVYPYIFQDPASGWWYMYGSSYDTPKVYDTSLIQLTLYKSADLRNWKYVSEHILNMGCRQYIAKHPTTGLWMSFGELGGFLISSASSPEGPWTVVTTIVTVNGVAVASDMGWFVDDNGIDAYFYFQASPNAIFCKLNSAWTAWDGVNFASYNVAATFGNQPPYSGGNNLDGPHMFQKGSTYFFIDNGMNNWAPTLNPYATATNPIGPFTNRGNPFVTQSGGTPDAALAFGTQNNYILRIPGRNAWIYTGDAYNLIQPGTERNSDTDNFQRWTEFYLPILFPTSYSMSIDWSPAWSADSAFPTVSGAPAAATALHFTSIADSAISLSWTNIETTPVYLYLDRASNSGFTADVQSEVLASDAVSFTDSNLMAGALYYRVRAVNANGSSKSNVIAAHQPLAFSGTCIVNPACSAALRVSRPLFGTCVVNPSCSAALRVSRPLFGTCIVNPVCSAVLRASKVLSGICAAHAANGGVLSVLLELSGICTATARNRGYLPQQIPESDRNQREMALFTSRFIDMFVPRYPGLLVKYENRNFVEPAGGIWVAFSVTSGKVADAAIGGLIARGVGVVFLQIFMSENFGTIQARKLADSFSTVFGRINIAYDDEVSKGNIWTMRPAISKSGLRAGWIEWTVSIDFRHDQYSPPVFAIP